MAINAATVWECRTSGNDLNGGGYSSGGTDYSQQDNPVLNVSDAACSGNTTVTSATGGFTAAMIGNVMYLSSGPGWYQITAYTDTNEVTIDRNGPNASGMTCRVGGAMKSPGLAAAQMAASNKIYVKAGTYTLTTTTPGADGPIVTPTNSRAWLIGYESSRGDNCPTNNRPLIDVGSTSPSEIIKINGQYGNTAHAANIAVDGQSLADRGFFSGAPAPQYDYLWNCTSKDCVVEGMYRCSAIYCMDDGSDIGLAGCLARYCRAINNGTYGFQTTSTTTLNNCFSYNSVTAGFYNVYGNVLSCCMAHTVTAGSGFLTAWGGGFVGCVAWNCSAYGYNLASGAALMYQCAHGSCTSGRSNGADIQDYDPVAALLADPFVDAANGNFNLNDVEGAGRRLRQNVSGVVP